MAWLSRSQLEAMGFVAIGAEVLISDRASFHNCGAISLGDCVRIDDFCVLSAGAGGIAIGSHVHVAVYTSLIGAGTIAIRDFANLSSRVSIYSSTDDFSGETMTNPMVPPAFTGVSSLPVDIGRHVVIGSGSVVLPGALLEEGVAVGALSLIKGRCLAFGTYAGVPARRVGERSRNLLARERDLLALVARPADGAPH
jgi:galactoside O-acetyltransferase